MPLLNSIKISHDLAQQRLLLNGRKLPLGHLERTLAWSLVVQYAAWEADQADDRLVSLEALSQVVGVPQYRLKHLVGEVRGVLLAFLPETLA